MSLVERQKIIVDEFSALKSWEDRYKRIISNGKNLEPLPQEFYDEKYKVKGCQSQVWLHAKVEKDNSIVYMADSDAMIVKGLVSLLIRAYSGATAEEILKTPPDFLKQIGLAEHLTPSRSNGLYAMLKQMLSYAQAFSMLK